MGAVGCLVVTVLLVLIVAAFVYGAVSGLLSDALNPCPGDYPFAASSRDHGTCPQDGPSPATNDTGHR